MTQAANPTTTTAKPGQPQPEAFAVVLDNVCLTYPNGVKAIREVDLKIRPGEQLALLGASGCGKTSLVGCLSGRLKPTDGRINCKGRIAVIHQDLRLVKQKSALQNVLHGSIGRVNSLRSLVSFPRHERERATELLKRVGLGHRVNQRVGRLSGGEQQRVAIARALMQEPQILLADEPVASLDPHNARETMNLLSRIARQENLTTIAVLHDQEIAKSFADRLVRMECGRVAYEGKPSLAPAERSSNLCSECAERTSETVSLNVLKPDTNLSTAPCPETQPPEMDEPAFYARHLKTICIAVISLLLLAWALNGIHITERQLEGALPSLARFIGDLVPENWEQVASIPWNQLGKSLIETLQMSLLGTALGVIIAWPLSALAADNVGPRFVRRPMRLLLNAIRTVPSLIWALLFVAAVGLGPFAGVLALAAYSVGYLTKFFYEGFEGVEPGPPDALREIGANGPQRFFHAVWPAAMPSVLSSSMFMLEYNVRAASVLGLVGAGGIGWYLMQFFEYRNFTGVLACLLLILAVVIVLDALSNYLRAKLVKA